MPEARAKRTVPPRKTGLNHLIASTRYSCAGFRRALHEAAFRQELVAFAIVMAWQVGLQSPLLLILAQAVAGFVLLATEALNTAIEEVVDHLTPEYSTMGKNAKDLGSFAVCCLLVANGLIALAAFFV
ncbi:diacylglycerol kinase [Fulvimarina sp. 2208YS6-2-32]|uniref:Diacylglycerol kinase n=1 Tax=Fulvimarina uroteuthidis TaxID=3098149 RepID=A0ABU5HY27_9HYPH|nr:diacylglycerol kinase [Fulvimarina sp. 2208YS6-2-32]MDY8107876.1 diacylglycerol kinase [Fulvimarina sp. 2208YS6-2-32]